MNRLFRTDTKEWHLNLAVFVTRVASGSMMLTHGVPKLNRLFDGSEISFSDPLSLGPGPSLYLAVFSEFLCSIFVILGLGTRLATIPLIITMAVAAFIVHGDDPFGRKEKALLFLVIFLFLLATGSRKYSLDHLLFGRSKRAV